MSGAFIDMALAVGAPVVPVRFVGGSRADPLATRLEFPLGMVRQDIHLGTPRCPRCSQAFTTAPARRSLSPRRPRDSDALEQPFRGDPDFVRRVNAWQSARGVSRTSTRRSTRILAELASPGDEVRRLLEAPSARSAGDESPEGRWLLELGRRLLGN